MLPSCCWFQFRKEYPATPVLWCSGIQLVERMIHHRLLHSAANEFAKSKKIQQKQASLLPDSREHPIVSKVRGTEPSMGRGRNPLSTSNRSRRNQSREVKERKRRCKRGQSEKKVACVTRGATKEEEGCTWGESKSQ